MVYLGPLSPSKPPEPGALTQRPEIIPPPKPSWTTAVVQLCRGNTPFDWFMLALTCLAAVLMLAALVFTLHRATVCVNEKAAESKLLADTIAKHCPNEIVVTTLYDENGKVIAVKCAHDTVEHWVKIPPRP